MHELENKRPANRSGIPQRRTKSDVMDANPENGLPLQSTHANPVSLNGPSLASGTSERQIFELNVQISALEAKLNEQTAALALKRLSDAQVVKQTKSIHHLETKVAELCSENAKLKQVKENAVPDSSAAETLITRLNLVQDEADDMSQQILDLSVSLKNKSATIARYETEAQAVTYANPGTQGAYQGS